MRSSFEPVLPALRPDLLDAARAAVHVHDDALEVLAPLVASTEGVPCEVVVWSFTFDPGVSSTLLVRHRTFRSWRQPGGRLGVGESVVAAALRELHEETGLDGRPGLDVPVLVDAHPSTTPDGRPNRSFGFGLLVVADPDRPLYPEPDQPAAWFPLDAPPEPRSRRHWERLLGVAEIARDAIGGGCSAGSPR